MYFVSVHVVRPYSSIDIATAWKKVIMKQTLKTTVSPTIYLQLAERGEKKWIKPLSRKLE